MAYNPDLARYEINLDAPKNDEDLPNYYKISDYLGVGPDSIQPQLDELEKDLTAIVDKRIEDALQYFAQQPQREKFRLDGKTPPPELLEGKKEFSKLVTKQMAELEIKNGFNPEIYSVYLKVLPEKQFLEEGKKGQHFKDLVSSAHGEYAHRMQWYLLMRSNTVTDFQGRRLFHKIVQIGKLWKNLFDREPAEPPAQWGKLDFRRPENMTEYLCSSAFVKKCPLVGNFFVGRLHKRKLGEFPGSTAKLDYISRKLTGTPYASLEKQDQAGVKIFYDKFGIVDPEKLKK